MWLLMLEEAQCILNVNFEYNYKVYIHKIVYKEIKVVNKWIKLRWN